MKKSVFIFVFLLTVVLTAVVPKKAMATHAAGGELLYEWVSDSTYRIYFKFYRACGPGATSAEPATQTVCYDNTCNNQSGTVTLTKTATFGPGGATNGTQVGQYCPGYGSYCTGGSLPGYEEWWYSNTVTLPSRCNFWRFSTAVGSRNGGILNFVNPGAQNLYIEATLDNVHAQGNSSPYFTVKPTPFVCLNAPYTYNNGAVDVNNDSLSFDLIMPRGGACGQSAATIPDLTFTGATPAFSLPSNPFPTNNTTVMSATTGQLSFTPSQLGLWVITVRVKEWRNGLLIGTVIRDIQIVVLTCNSLQPTINPVASSISGAQLVGGTVQGCAGTPLAFCVDLKSADTGSKLICNDNHLSVAPTSTMSYSTQQTDSVRACFSWTPSLLDTGLKILTISVKDSNCSNGGIIVSQTFTVPIYIAPITQILKDTTICPGDSITLTAIGGSQFTWSVLPGGSPLSTLSCTNCKNPVAKPLVTTQYVVLSNNLSFCNRNKDTVTITVPQPPVFDAGPDITTCINNLKQLNINLTPSPGTQYHVQWTPSTYLNNDTIENPVANPTNDITYFIEVTPNGLQRCSTRDTLSLTVLQGYTIFNNDTAICAGNSVTINAAGDARYNFNWTPAIGVSNVAIMNPQITPDTSHLYTVVGSYPGCKDTALQLYIDVQPNPIPFIGGDQVLCYGDTIHFDFATVSPSSYPYYTYSWTPSGAFSDDTMFHPIYTALTTADVKLVVKTPAGCTDSAQVHIDAVPSHFLTVTPEEVVLCPGDSAQLHLTGDYVWLVWRPTPYISDTNSADPYVYPTTSSMYTVLGRNMQYCLDSVNVPVTIRPQALLSLPDTATIYPGEVYNMLLNTNGLYFQWFPPIGLSATNISNPVASPTVNTRYHVTATTEAGCSATDSIDIFVAPDSYLDMPNAFMPATGTGTLKATRRGIATLKSFVIYNRWGQKMFETTNIDAGWDGRLNGQEQPMGVYIYVIDAITPAGKRFTKQGNVTLVR